MVSLQLKSLRWPLTSAFTGKQRRWRSSRIFDSRHTQIGYASKYSSMENEATRSTALWTLTCRVYLSSLPVPTAQSTTNFFRTGSSSYIHPGLIEWTAKSSISTISPAVVPIWCRLYFRRSELSYTCIRVRTAAMRASSALGERSNSVL